MGKTEIPVTPEIAYIGMKVTKGQNWYFGDQDVRQGGNGVGTIARFLDYDHKNCEVAWRGGYRDNYPVGNYILNVYNEDKDEGKIEEIIDPSKWPIFKVGDRVILKKKDKYRYCDRSHLSIGDSYEVSSVGAKQEGGPAVILKDTMEWWIPSYCFELSGEKVAYHVGDWVYLVSHDGGFTRPAGLEVGGKYKITHLENGPYGRIKTASPAMQLWIQPKHFSFSPPNAQSPKKEKSVKKDKLVKADTTDFEPNDEVYYTYPGDIPLLDVGSYHKVVGVDYGKATIQLKPGGVWYPAKSFTLKKKGSATTTKDIPEEKKTRLMAGDYVMVAFSTAEAFSDRAIVADYYQVKEVRMFGNKEYVTLWNYAGTDQGCRGSVYIPSFSLLKRYRTYEEMLIARGKRSAAETLIKGGVEKEYYEPFMGQDKQGKEDYIGEQIKTFINKTQTKTAHNGKESSSRSSRESQQPQVRRKTRTVQRTEGRKREGFECRRRKR